MIVSFDQHYFRVLTECGRSWPGMRHTQDVRIVLDRAMDHEDKCEACRPQAVHKIVDNS